MNTKAPDRVSDLYTTYYRQGSVNCDVNDSPDSVILRCWGLDSAGASMEFQLPRQADLFDQTKRMLWAAFNCGREIVRSDLRGLLGVKECSCGDD
jgi:hypothetical protein